MKNNHPTAKARGGRILFSLLVAAMAGSILIVSTPWEAATPKLDWVYGKYITQIMGIGDSTPAGWALPKLNELLVVASVIITFTLLSGNKLDRSTSFRLPLGISCKKTDSVWGSILLHAGMDIPIMLGIFSNL